jgi:hypothetical protein
MWLLNDGRFVNMDSFTLTSTDITTNGYVTLSAGAYAVAALSSADPGFLRKDENGAPAITWYNSVTNEMTNISVMTEAQVLALALLPVDLQAAARAVNFVYNPTGHVLTLPTGTTFTVGDRLEALYAANGYGNTTENTYFQVLDATSRPDFLGALRQGQVEVYIVANDATEWDIAWRLTGCTISADLTREPLSELGHLGPYDRPLTLPIPITVTVDSTAGDLENWSKVANKLTEFDANTLDDINLSDLMASEDLKLVVKVYAQTDEEAGGTGSNRTVRTGSDLIGQSYWNDGTMATYAAGNQEYALKTIIVEHLKITDEGNTLDMGANMTQTFGFRSTNDLYVVKGDLSIGNITGDFKVRRNG